MPIIGVPPAGQVNSSLFMLFSLDVLRILPASDCVFSYAAITEGCFATVGTYTLAVIDRVTAILAYWL